MQTSTTYLPKLNKKLGFLFGLGLLTSTMIAQKPAPESNYSFPFKTPSETIQSAIQSQQKVFTIAEWDEVEASVRRNNANVEAKIREIDLKTDEIYRQLKKLQAANNIVELQNNLDALRASRKRIIETTEKQLQEIHYQGLYLGIVSQAKPFDMDADHVVKIQNTVLQDAIPTLNGAFIQNIMELKDYKVEYDYLMEKVSGSMEMGAVEFEDRSFAAGYFLQVRNIKVYPLQQKINLQNGIVRNENVKALDLVHNTNYISELSFINDAELRARIAKFLEDKLQTLTFEIQKFNEASSKSEANIIFDAKEKLAEQDRKIKAAEDELNRNIEGTKAILKEVEVAFNLSDLKGCLNEAETKLQSKRNELNRDKSNTKSDELIYQVFDVSAQGGNPAEAISKDAVTKIGVINQGNSQLKGFLKEISIKNNAVEDMSIGTATDVFREVETYWIYPVPFQNFFRLALVAKFKVIGKAPGISTTPDEPKKSPQPAVLTSLPEETPKSPSVNADPKPKKPNFTPANAEPATSTQNVSVAMQYVAGGMGLAGITAVKWIDPFYISQKPISVKDFARFVSETNYKTDADLEGWSYVQDEYGRFSKQTGINWQYNGVGRILPESEYDKPVVHVSINDAKAYCRWLSDVKGVQYRLPDEHEYQYAIYSVNMVTYRHLVEFCTEKSTGEGRLIKQDELTTLCKSKPVDYAANRSGVSGFRVCKK